MYLLCRLSSNYQESGGLIYQFNPASFVSLQSQDLDFQRDGRGMSWSLFYIQ